MKYILKPTLQAIVCVVLVLGLLYSVSFAARTTPNFFNQDGTNIYMADSTYTFGDASNEILNGRFTSLTIGTATISGSVAGDLSVAGNTTLGDASTDTLQLDTGLITSASPTTWTLNNAVNALNFDSNTLSIDAANNRVGIATTTPTTTLSVAGTALIYGGDFTVTEGGNIILGTGGSFTIKDSSDVNSAEFQHDDTDFFMDVFIGDLIFKIDASEKMRIKETTGNVGIGVADPDVKLEVFATTTQLKLSYDASNSVTFATDSSGNLDVTPSGGTATVSGALVIEGDTTLGDATADTITFTGNFLLGTDGASGTSAATTTSPTDTTCIAGLVGTLVLVQDTNGVGIWLWACENTGASSYDWARIN